MGARGTAYLPFFWTMENEKAELFRKQMYKSTWKSSRECSSACLQRYSAGRSHWPVGVPARAQRHSHKTPQPWQQFTIVSPTAWGGKTDKYKGLVSAPILVIPNFHCLENHQKGLACEPGKWAHLLLPQSQEQLQSSQPGPVLGTFYFSAHTHLAWHCPLHPQPSGFLTRYFHQEVTFIKLSLRVLPFCCDHLCVMLFQE